ncbi:MAG: hypothetical protein L3J39_17810 [Verrucomicrobiales bacterium]|nr:hypothetical protein [Verrucomicrobiales bacterium]
MKNRIKMRCVLGMLCVVSLAVVVFAEEPQDLNCDFESGLKKWRGDGRLKEDEKGNKVCQLKKKGKRRAEITHKIELPGDLAFDIHYRVRALQGSEKVKVRHSVRNSKGAGFVTKDLKGDGQWVDMKFSAKAAEGDRKSDRIIAIIFYEGEGVIQVDDIKVVAK